MAILTVTTSPATSSQPMIRVEPYLQDVSQLNCLIIAITITIPIKKTFVRSDLSSTPDLKQLTENSQRLTRIPEQRYR